MARTKTNTPNDTKTRRVPWHNIHLEKKLFFCVFRIFLFFSFVRPQWNFGRIMVWFPSVRLSVCPSVRLSVRASVSHIMSAQYLEMFLNESHGSLWEDWSWSVNDSYKFWGHYVKGQGHSSILCKNHVCSIS